MSDRQNDVLAAIDGALDDWTVSGDAMRWQPPGAERELPKRPVDRYAVGRTSDHRPPSIAHQFPRRSIEWIDISGLVVAVEGFGQAVGQLSMAAGISIGEAGRSLTAAYRSFSTKTPLTGDDFRRRALEHQQNRGTGPQPGRRIPPRDLRR